MIWVFFSRSNVAVKIQYQSPSTSWTTCREFNSRQPLSTARPRSDLYVDKIPWFFTSSLKTARTFDDLMSDTDLRYSAHCPALEGNCTNMFIHHEDNNNNCDDEKSIASKRKNEKNDNYFYIAPASGKKVRISRFNSRNIIRIAL